LRAEPDMDTVDDARTLRAMKTDLSHLLLSGRSRLFRRSARVWPVVFTLSAVRSADADPECSPLAGQAAHAATEAEARTAHPDHPAPGDAAVVRASRPDRTVRCT